MHFNTACKDGYYKCLLVLPAEKLLQMLADMDGQSNEWFNMHLQGIADAGLSDDDILAIADAEPAAGAPDAGIQGAVAIALLSRCTVDAGDDTRSIKVYFDNCTHQSGEQRGWMGCLHHDACIRYKFVSGATRHQFCAEMYAWHEAGDRLTSKAQHLEHAPVQDIVDCNSMVLRCFDF